MSLDLGALVGRIGMDISPLERALMQGDTAMGKFAAKGEADAKTAGNRIGDAVAVGLDVIAPAAMAAGTELGQALALAESGARQSGDAIGASVAAGMDQIPVAARVAAGQIDTVLGDSLDGVGAKLRAAGADAGREGAKGLEDGLGNTREIGEDAGEEAGEGLSDGLEAKAALAGAAAGAAVVGGVMSAMDVEPAVDKLSAQLGMTEERSKKIGAAAGRLYAGAYGENMGEVTEAIQFVMRNIDGMRSSGSADIEHITARVLDLATAFDQDLGMTTAAIGQMLRTGLAKDATEAMDILTKALQGPANKADDLMETVNEYGTQFRKLGIDGATAMGILQQGLLGGARDADLVADALKEFSIKTQEALQQTASDGTVLMTDLGAAFEKVLPKSMDMYDAQQLLAEGGKGAAKTFDTMIDGLRKIEDPATRSRVAVALFGTMSEDLGDALYALDPSKAAKQLGDFTGATEDMSKTLNDNAATNLTSFGRQLKMVFIDVLGGTVLPAVSSWASTMATEVGPAITTIAQGLQGSLMPRLQEWISIIVAVAVPALHAMASVLGAVTAFLTEHATVAKGLGIALVALTVITQAHAAAMAVSAAGGMLKWLQGTKLITAATKVWTAVQWAWNLAMSANPLGILIVAVAALVAGFIIAYKNSETFRNIVNGALTGIRDVALAVFDWLKGAVVAVVDFMVGAWETLRDATVVVWDAITSATSTAWTAVLDFVKAIPGRIVEYFLNWTLPGLIIKHWDDIKAGTTRVWNTVVDFVKAIPGKLLAFFLNWTLPGLIIKHWDSIKDGTIRVATAIVDWVKGLPERFTSALSTLKEKITTVFGGAMDAARDKVIDIAAKIVDVVRDIPGKLKDLGSKFLEAGGVLIGKFFDGLKKLGDIGANIGKSLLNGIIDGINAGINAINSMIPDSIGIGPASIDLPNNPFPNISRLATGGRVSGGGILAVIGEGREAESVLPDSLLRGLLERVHADGAATVQPAAVAAIDYDRLAAALAKYAGDPDALLDGFEALAKVLKTQPRTLIRLMRMDPK